MIRIKENVNVLECLKEQGITSYQIRKRNIMGESRVQRLRHGALPSWHELDIICRITGKDVADLIEYVPDQVEQIGITA